MQNAAYAPHPPDAWRSVGRQLPEWPALPAELPRLEFNRPGLQVVTSDGIEAARRLPEQGGSDVWVVGAHWIPADATRRIRATVQRFHCSGCATTSLVDRFTQALAHRR